MDQTVQWEISKNIVAGVAITSILFAISLYLPIFGFFCPFFIPLPILFYRSKLGRQMGAVVPALSFMVMVVLAGAVSPGILFFLDLMLIGFILGEIIEMNLPIERTVLYTFVIAMSAGIFCLILYGNMSDSGFRSLMENLSASLDNFEATLYDKSTGMSEENIRKMVGSMRNLRLLMRQMIPLIPGMAGSSVLFVIWTTLLMAKPVLKGRGLFYPDFGSLKLWKVPEFLVWGVIGCGSMLLIPDGTFKIIGLNGLLILMTIYFFGGIAIVSFYFEKKNFPFLLRSFLYALILLQVMAQLFVIGLGFFDMWLNFRKLETEN